MAGDVIYERAIAEWIERNSSYKAEDISDIKFATIQHGACETCEYTTFGLEFKLKTKKKAEWHPGWDYEDVDLEYTDPATFLREVTEIIADRFK